MRSLQSSLRPVSGEPSLLCAAAGDGSPVFFEAGDSAANQAHSVGGPMGTGGVRLVLPWPPSANRIWRSIVINGSVRVLLSEDGRRYRKAVADVVTEHAARVVMLGQSSLAVRITALPPDRRRRDLDNLAKAALDALQHAGVYRDDSQIDDLRIRRAELSKPDGMLVVDIARIAT